MNVFIALLKREILEHRNILKVPIILLIIAVLLRLSLVAGNFSINFDAIDQFNLEDMKNSAVNAALIKTLGFMNSVTVFVMSIVGISYALSCLHNERVDESVLFWRSLPVSDTLTVASKLAIALVVIPVVILFCSIFTAIIFLGVNSLEYLPSYYEKFLPTLVGIVVWTMLPVISWCIFCSEIANKNPFLLAFVAPIIFVAVDRLFLNGVISQYLVIDRFTGVADKSMTTFLGSLLFSAVCLSLAVLKRGQRF